MRRKLEHAAVREELKISQLDATSSQYINRITYPERTAILDYLVRAKIRKQLLTPKETFRIRELMDSIIERALGVRNAVRQELLSEFNNPSTNFIRRLILKKKITAIENLNTLRTDLKIDSAPLLDDIYKERFDKIKSSFTWP